MDNNSAQNQQDDGFSLMYGQPFGSPQKPQDDDVKKEPEVIVKEETTTIPTVPPVIEEPPVTEPKEQITPDIEPVPETPIETVTPISPTPIDDVATTQQTPVQDDQTSTPTDDQIQTTTDDQTRTDNKKKEEDKLIDENPVSDTPKLEEKPMDQKEVDTALSIEDPFLSPTPVQPPTTTPMDDQPPTVAPVTTPIDDQTSTSTTSAPSKDSVTTVKSEDTIITSPSDFEPATIEQALGLEPETQPQQETEGTVPVPLPTDITEEPEKEEPKEEYKEEPLTDNKISIKEKLLNEETSPESPVEEYSETPNVIQSETPIEEPKLHTEEEIMKKFQLEPEITATEQQLSEPIPEQQVPTTIPDQPETAPIQPQAPVTELEITPEVIQETLQEASTPLPEQPVQTLPVEAPQPEQPSQSLATPIEESFVVNQPIQSPEQEIPKQPATDQVPAKTDTTAVKTQPDSQKRLKGLNISLKFATIVGVLFLVVALTLVAIPTLPYLWYRISSGATANETESISEPATSTGEDSFSNVIEISQNSDGVDLPEYDGTLPYYNTLIIPSIGVNGVIHEGDDPQASLEDGIWIVNDFGTPEDINTIILAAHRFGYITWSNDFRTENSFYNLPKTKVGDKIEIVWKQRKYEYEITYAEEGTTIKDYESDLILYTCKLFNTPVRILRYANRTN